MKIYCCGCNSDVDARLGDGGEAYPHRQDLKSLPFWFCDGCGNFVGCHHKTNDPTRPLGIIATKEIKNARRHIHALLDPLWESGKIKRKHLYARISEHIGKQYHTAEIKSIEEARAVYRAIREVAANG